VITERLSLDPTNRDIMHDENDHDGQRVEPPLVDDQELPPACKKVSLGPRTSCTEGNPHIVIRQGKSITPAADGALMPVKKDQPPPDFADTSNQTREVRKAGSAPRDRAKTSLKGGAVELWCRVSPKSRPDWAGFLAL